VDRHRFLCSRIRVIVRSYRVTDVCSASAGFVAQRVGCRRLIDKSGNEYHWQIRPVLVRSRRQLNCEQQNDIVPAPEVAASGARVRCGDRPVTKGSDHFGVASATAGFSSTTRIVSPAPGRSGGTAVTG
jgi:hypothetical protein